MLTKEQQHVLSCLDEKGLIRFLQRLVQTNSENPPGNEQTVAQIIADELHHSGIDTVKHTVEDDRFNVIAVREGMRKEKLLFNGHMDTVLCGDVERWDNPPLSGKIIGNKLFGRGTADMKGGLAAQIFAFKALVCSGIPFKRGMMLTAVVDEEVGFKGTQALIDDHWIDDCIYGVVAEPSSLHIADCLKGGIEFTLRVYGRSAHTGVAATGDNAIISMTRMIGAIETYSNRLRRRHHPMLGSPTCNIGRIEGGYGVTVVPEFCDLAFDRQLLPGEQITEVENEMKDLLYQKASELGIHMDLVRTLSFPGWQLSHDDVLTLLLHETHKLLYGRPATYTGFNGYSEVELLARYGLPSLIFGPGNLAAAHAPNESISLDEVIEAARVYTLLGYQFVSKLSNE
ncbi:M20 family metallopeptidase [Sporolactobacillus shoreicorticis]|uniref:Probable succinyl-diaminopimelate desuccinylase n=1 Tax=Sporolactobacillus shoreicorticis TaxID=1923877 RepID=A0ABW5S1M1_9BACL|nr:M20 family metallopeptidase [Sporolactobacillus shoreicorticis]MCO7125284.1 M20 family metallopeptidase [Sporolactobacillus shoreicorticis]